MSQFSDERDRREGAAGKPQGLSTSNPYDAKAIWKQPALITFLLEHGVKNGHDEQLRRRLRYRQAARSDDILVARMAGRGGKAPRSSYPRACPGNWETFPDFLNRIAERSLYDVDLVTQVAACRVRGLCHGPARRPSGNCDRRGRGSGAAGWGRYRSRLRWAFQRETAIDAQDPGWQAHAPTLAAGRRVNSPVIAEGRGRDPEKGWVQIIPDSTIRRGKKTGGGGGPACAASRPLGTADEPHPRQAKAGPALEAAAST